MNAVNQVTPQSTGAVTFSPDGVLAEVRLTADRQQINYHRQPDYGRQPMGDASQPKYPDRRFLDSAELALSRPSATRLPFRRWWRAMGDSGAMAVNLIRSTLLFPGAPYAYAAKAGQGDLVFTAGACPLDEQGQVVAPGDVRAQMSQALRNLRTALEESGAAISDVVKTTVYVASSDRVDLVTAWDEASGGLDFLLLACGGPARQKLEPVV